MKKLALLIMIACIAASLPVFAEDTADDAVASGTMVCQQYIGMKDKLGLSQDQVAKLKEIHENMGKKNKDLIQQRNELNKQVRDMMQADDPDLNGVEAKVKELEKTRTQIQLNRLSAAKDANKVLTREQKQKIQQMKAERKQYMKGRIQQKKKMMKKGM